MPTHPIIVVTNDDPTYMDLIHELLTEEGYPTVITVVGDRAYDIIREQQPDLLLVDVNIRNPATGWSTLDRVKLDPRTTNIPIVICTTDRRLPTEKADWLREKRVDYMEKPFDLNDLLTKVAAHIGPPLKAKTTET